MANYFDRKKIFLTKIQISVGQKNFLVKNLIFCRQIMVENPHFWI